MPTELQRAAMLYSEMGLAVFPLAVHGKTPLTKNGLYDASSDPAVIQGWWEKWPDANIGLVTGVRNSLVVIDLDIDESKGINGADSLRNWQRENGALPESWRSITGRGGNHLFYRSSDSFRNRVSVIPGVDVRADGGYIVAPPSIHPNGNPYRWEISPDDCALADLNDNVRALLAIRASKATDSCGLAIPDIVSEGRRNDTMFRIACSLQAKGLSDEAILAACLNENGSRFSPPLEESEIRTIVKSCTDRFSKGRPIFFDSAGDAVQGRRAPKLQFRDNGSVLQTIRNAQEAIEYDEQLYGKIRYNEISYAPFITGPVPWDPVPGLFREWTNFDDSALKAYIEAKYGLTNANKCMDALNNVIARNRFNPIVDVLTDIWKNKWDGRTGYIAKLLPVYLGVPENSYTYEVMRIFMLGAISRAFSPGTKFDYMLVIRGEQGVGKSTFLRYLALDNSWFNDNFNTIDGDKASEKLRGMWIVELAELLAAKKTKEQESIKAFLTSTVDTYRAPYGKRTEQRPRLCVFAGTTNTEHFLSDQTGGRRYLPVEASRERQQKRIPDCEDELRSDIVNAWGEAMDIFMKADRHPVLRLTEEIEKSASEMQTEHTEEDPRIGIIQEWLDSGKYTRVCAMQIFVEALGNVQSMWTHREINDIHQIMQSQINGWQRLAGKCRCGHYGVQICYEPVPGSLREDFGSDDDLPF